MWWIAKRVESNKFLVQRFFTEKKNDKDEITVESPRRKKDDDDQDNNDRDEFEERREKKRNRKRDQKEDVAFGSIYDMLGNKSKPKNTS